MVISGIIGTVSLVGILVALFAAGIALAVVDNYVDRNREH